MALLSTIFIRSLNFSLVVCIIAFCVGSAINYLFRFKWMRGIESRLSCSDRQGPCVYVCVDTWLLIRCVEPGEGKSDIYVERER